jgi:hypothetical protein
MMTESWVATAYTILYGREKMGLGPGEGEELAGVAGTSGFSCFGLDVGVSEGFSAAARAVGFAGGGGGSIPGAVSAGFATGSGSDSIVSSEEEVSMVRFSVASAAAVRRV